MKAVTTPTSSKSGASPKWWLKRLGKWLTKAKESKGTRWYRLIIGGHIMIGVDPLPLTGAAEVVVWAGQTLEPHSSDVLLTPITHHTWVKHTLFLTLGVALGRWLATSWLFAIGLSRNQ
jgi:hypothetical protein